MFNEIIKIKKIDISYLLGKVIIKPHDLKEVKIESTEEDKVSIEHSGSTLFIKSKEDNTTKSSKGSFIKNVFNSSINIGGKNFSGNNINIVNGKVIVDGNIMDSTSTITKVDMTIYVPKDMIKKIDVSGQINVSIEGISDRLAIDNSGQTSIDIEGIREINLDTSNQSKAFIRDIEVIEVDISGQSSVDIIGNKIEEITIDASGMSSVDIEGIEINELDIDISGMSNIRVRGNVINKSIDQSGMSSIKFR